jgi:CBS domain-containing protein
MEIKDQPVASLRLEPPIRVAAGTTLREAAAVMQDHRTSCVLVGEGPPQVVTEHDLAGALAAGMGAEAPLGPIASSEVIWATATTTLLDALAMMHRHRIRHLVVLRATGEVDGVLSLERAIDVLVGRVGPD